MNLLCATIVFLNFKDDFLCIFKHRGLKLLFIEIMNKKVMSNMFYLSIISIPLAHIYEPRPICMDIFAS